MSEEPIEIPKIIPLPDDFAPIIGQREYPFYAFVVEGEVAMTVEFTPVIQKYDKINAIHMSDPKIVPVWERIPEGYLYDAETGTFSAPE